MSERYSPVSKSMYDAAAKLVELYAEQQRKHIKKTIPLIDAEIERRFPDGGLLEWVTKGEWEKRDDTINYTIYPQLPEFDDDYHGEFDSIIQQIAAWMGINLKITSSVYGK